MALCPQLRLRGGEVVGEAELGASDEAGRSFDPHGEQPVYRDAVLAQDSSSCSASSAAEGSTPPISR